MSKEKVLIIDDDVDICTLLKRFLENNGYEAETAFSASSGLKILRKEAFNLVLSDYRLPDQGGVKLIQAIKEIDNSIQVVVITGYSDVKQAINCIKSGAYEYVTKPIQPEEILSTIKNALKYSEDRAELYLDKPKSSTTKAEATKALSYVVGTSADAKKLAENIELIAPTNMSVIILGETGTGKEVAARMIHERSTRAEEKFVAVDCGALPKELASSELFGHVKGSFTGAVTDRKGSFELANKGTLFLDEIGNLTYENQIKLLRVIQERQIKRVGGSKDIDIDVRILVATNDDLMQEVSEGNFREDLYYRLNEFKIELPPLRERKSDLLTFADHFLDLANKELNRKVTRFSDEVISKLKDYYWHGNLRELKNVVKRATLLTQGDTIKTSALPQDILYPSFMTLAHTADEDHEITDLKSVAERAEKAAIEEVLQKTGFNKTKTAEILQIDRKTLYNKMTSYGIEL